MPSHLTFMRKLPVSRGSGWHDRGPVRSLAVGTRNRCRLVLGTGIFLLVAVFILIYRHLSVTEVHILGCGMVEDTLRSILLIPPTSKVFRVVSDDQNGLPERLSYELVRGVVDPLQGVIRPKVTAFVGIQTGFRSGERRKSLRQTWFPSTREDLARLEGDVGLAFRFIIGHTSDRKMMAELEQEIETYHDFVRLDTEELYERLPYKTLAFFKAAYILFDADFYVKADDDIYLRPDRLAILLKKERHTPLTYLGCMKKGQVISNPGLKWFEPLGYLLGNEYFLHAYGPIYALSRGVVTSLAHARNDSGFRMFSNEDVTIGSWMLAMNVHHEDDRKLCAPECRSDSIAVWDIPRCSGLCNPEKRLLDLHQIDMCSKSPTISE